MKKKFVYGSLPAVYDFYFFRLGGNGLANCLFIYGRAIIACKENNLELIDPTWNNYSIGAILRKQSDRRRYNKIFKSERLSGFSKLFYLIFFRNKIQFISGLDNYFKPLLGRSLLIKNYLYNMLSNYMLDILPNIDYDFIAVHIRLGDLPEKNRIPLNWFLKIIMSIIERDERDLRILVFSDATNAEINEITELPYVERAFYGSAMADIWAISQARLIIGSDSTFSAWSAFLGQKPILFFKRHFGNVLDNPDHEYVCGENLEDGLNFVHKILDAN